MSAPSVTYWASREQGRDTYTLTLEFSDLPGKTIIYGQTKEQCECEVQSAKELGYEIVSGLRRAFEWIGWADPQK